MIQIKIQGLDKTNKLLANLPKNLNNELLRKSEDFTRLVQKSAKLRAPRFTGQLAESIKVFKDGKTIKLIVESPYGIFQETGFTPKFLPSAMPVLGGYRIMDWMQAKGIKGRGIMPRGIPHPFIMPALEKGLSILPSRLMSAVYDALTKSK